MDILDNSDNGCDKGSSLQIEILLTRFP